MRRATLAAVVAAVALLGCGEDEPARDPLAWSGPPQVKQPPSLPRDRVLSARVRNRSGDALELQADRVVVRDASGRRLRSSAAFLSGYVYSHVPYNRGRDEVPSALPRPEQERLGRVVRIPPGGTAPLTVSWTGESARSIDYGGGSLPVPEN